MHCGGFGDLQGQAVGWQVIVAQGPGNAVNQTGMAELDRGQVDRHAPVVIPLVKPLAHLPAGLVQHPFANRNDQAGFFRQANEAVRQ
ncbi:hypothetical protein D3C73_1382700 [compost metagenome]